MFVGMTDAAAVGSSRWDSAPRQFLLAAALLLLPTCAASAQTATRDNTSQPAPPQYSARITRVDSEGFPTVRVYVSITDSQGNNVRGGLPVTVSLAEDGKRVRESKLSEGLAVSTVMVLDLSKSMEGEKLRKAKEAAIAYMGMVPSTYRFALVGVSSTAQQLCPGGAQPPCGFTDNVASLRNRINGLTATGKTALKDGFGKALDLLRTRNDRKVVILLTDGYDTASSVYTDKFQLVTRSKSERCEVFTIGLGVGDMVDSEYLESLTTNGGRYLNSPTAAELNGTFQQVAADLQKEHVFEYVSASADPNGLPRSLSVVLSVGGVRIEEVAVFTAPGLIPHVPGRHAPYLFLLVSLLVAPTLFAFARSLQTVHRFRSDQLVRLDSKSPLLGKRDPNVGKGGETFRAGDLIVACPSCPTPHYVRSWRMNRCHCMFEPKGEGSYCYHRKLPQWLRGALDSMFGRQVGETGRRWLCRCAGDRDGY